MKHSSWITCLIAASIFMACSDSTSDVDDGGSTNSGINVQLTASGHPDYMQTTTLRCTYEVDGNAVPPGRTECVVNGHFDLPITHFAVESGDSSWVDTVTVNTVHQRQVVIRAIKKGDWLVDALATSTIEEGVSVISGAASIELRVR